ncbi:hypothetical protein LOAG_12540 [Loa loa]|uniref:Uncharacterized protein n=1 Tax=Loa loa TaxID=7209 RepID=A0A1S0TLH0_LOALO|nr:hypothetical protein LOAG_12540 [Loa loa]EFO15970.2 hypothetical protein LOAG_12540 [Loa loa]
MEGYIHFLKSCSDKQGTKSQIIGCIRATNVLNRLHAGLGLHVGGSRHWLLEIDLRDDSLDGQHLERPSIFFLRNALLTPYEEDFRKSGLIKAHLHFHPVD